MSATVKIADHLAKTSETAKSAKPLRFNRQIVAVVAAFHAGALLACIPWLFSWSGLAWAVCGLYLFGTLGVNIGFHRLLTHRGFSCPRWLEHAFSVLGVCCLQGTPMSWVAIHRMHHQYSDEPGSPGDPHSPRTGFFWSHMGWFLIYDPAIYDMSTYDRYARDLFQDRFYKQLEKPRNRKNIQVAQWAAFFTVGATAGGLLTWSVLGALQLGLSWVVWGVLVRTVAVWHITWSVNSLSHMFGYRNYTTQDDSRNNWLVGLISNGEGWHNNHHADPRSVKNGHRWWELDVSYLTVKTLSFVGLTWNLVTPRRRQEAGPAEERRAA